jgi:hypothetical protein
MGRRSEVRIAKHLPILVHGTDPSGSPLRIPAKTVDISVTGASLTGLSGAGLPGTKIEIEYQGKRRGSEFSGSERMERNAQIKWASVAWNRETLSGGSRPKISRSCANWLRRRQLYQSLPTR